MTSYAALLRGINVGGNRMVAMADLRSLVTKLGFSDVRTLLQSGNVVFRDRARPTPQIERLLEAEAAKRLGLQTDFVVRTSVEWQSIIAANPFQQEAESAPARLLVLLFKKAPTPAAVQAFKKGIVGPEIVHAAGRELYIVCPNGVGKARLKGAVLGVPGTGRNWNTVLKLAAALEPARAGRPTARGRSSPS
jgi:uncharacterized protein (DUF1697 family)